MAGLRGPRVEPDRHPVRRMEAAPGAGLRRAAPPADRVSRRTDLGRRSDFAPAVLGADSADGRDGVTVFVTTHYMDEAEYCNRLALINRGELSRWARPPNSSWRSIKGAPAAARMRPAAARRLKRVQPLRRCSRRRRLRQRAASGRRRRGAAAPAIRAALEAAGNRSHQPRTHSPEPRRCFVALTGERAASRARSCRHESSPPAGGLAQGNYPGPARSRSLLIVLLMPLMLMTVSVTASISTPSTSRCSRSIAKAARPARIFSNAFRPPSISIWSSPSPTTVSWPPPSTTADAQLAS